MRILVTGGAGFIGSHTCIQLIEQGLYPVVYDNFSNSNPNVVRRMSTVAGRDISAVQGDVCDRSLLEATIDRYGCEAVIHFAGAKAVGESMADPVGYYINNVAGTLTVIEAMSNCGVNRLIFSSSASVYGQPTVLPIPEAHALAPISVYGDTKLVAENLMRSLHRAHPDWSIVILRYFNPVGAHRSGLIGEDPNDIPNNLMPYLSQVAAGLRPALQLYGNDYDTPDGTGVRDYIHVEDLAAGHIAALGMLDDSGCTALNLGTGRGVSVLELIAAFSQATGRSVPYQITRRRPGDVAACYADPTRAHDILGWKAQRTVYDMCRDSWNWQQRSSGTFDQLAVARTG